MKARVALVGALLTALPLTACSGGSGGGAGAASAGGAAAAARWYPAHAGYCDLLRQTVRAGRSILPGVGADDPARLASTRAFVADLQRAAPPAVAGAWQVLGPAVVKIVASGGRLATVKGVDPAAVQHAATTIAAHARQACHVDVSRTGS